MIQSFLFFLSGYYIEIWTICGLGLILAEMFIVPGVGLLFVGLGALSVGLLSIILPEIYDLQYIIFIISSLIWFIILWGPIKNYTYKTGNNTVSTLVGSKVKVVGNNLVPGEIGQVMWSGTIMNAMLASHINITIKIDTIVEVVEINGNILICIPV